MPAKGRYTVVDHLGRWLAPTPAKEVVDIHGLRVAMDHAHFSCRTMYYRVYEDEFVHFLRRTLRPGDAFMDLGANIGYITAVAHGLVGSRGRVLAYEPSRTCFDELRANNPVWPKGVSITNAAITDRVGSMPFLDTERVVSMGFSVLLHNRTPGPGDKVYEVQATTIDHEVERHGLERVACVKMDIEGAEVIALHGAAHTLEKAIADHVLVEMTNLVAAHRAQNTAIVELLAGRGYLPHKPDGAGRLLPYPIDITKDFRADVIWRSPRVMGHGR